MPKAMEPEEQRQAGDGGVTMVVVADKSINGGADNEEPEHPQAALQAAPQTSVLVLPPSHSDVILGGVLGECVQHVIYCVSPAGKCFGMSSLPWGLAQGLQRATEEEIWAVCICAGHVRGQI